MILVQAADENELSSVDGALSGKTKKRKKKTIELFIQILVLFKILIVCVCKLRSEKIRYLFIEMLLTLVYVHLI